MATCENGPRGFARAAGFKYLTVTLISCVKKYSPFPLQLVSYLESIGLFSIDRSHDLHHLRPVIALNAHYASWFYPEHLRRELGASLFPLLQIL